VSEWCAPLLFVRKANGTLRMCVDYRGLNQVTKKVQQPIPRIEELLDKLSGAACFSSLDLASGYWQVPVKEEHRHLTAFSAEGELWEWCVMPFGLTSAPTTFQRMMNKLLAPLSAFCVVYLDDILIFSTSAQEHTEHLELVMQTLRSANLVACKPKCHLYRTELKLLGHIVGNGVIKTNPEKVRAITNWPRPSNLKGLRGFLALAGWYRNFVEDLTDDPNSWNNFSNKTRFHPRLRCYDWGG
jgi:hypothetical protein